MALPNQTMRIEVFRIDAHRYRTVVERDDGVMLQVPGYGFMRALPHDLEHFAVESALGKASGFWGSIAAGAIFRGMEVLGGRRKPHASECALAVAKSNAASLSEAEVVVAAFEAIVAGNLDRQWPRAEGCLKERLSARPFTHLPGPDDIAAVCTAWRELQARWDRTAIGGCICLRWPAGAVRPRSRAKQR